MAGKTNNLYGKGNVIDIQKTKQAVDLFSYFLALNFSIDKNLYLAETSG